MGVALGTPTCTQIIQADYVAQDTGNLSWSIRPAEFRSRKQLADAIFSEFFQLRWFYRASDTSSEF